MSSSQRAKGLHRVCLSRAGILCQIVVVSFLANAQGCGTDGTAEPGPTAARFRSGSFWNEPLPPGDRRVPAHEKPAGSISDGEATRGVLTFRAQELPFRYDRGETKLALPVETTGGGVGLLDFDGDGDLDLFFAQGGPLVSRGSAGAPSDVLLRNDGGGRFVDISTQVRLGYRGYGQGLAIPDYDGAGAPDV